MKTEAQIKSLKEAVDLLAEAGSVEATMLQKLLEIILK